MPEASLAWVKVGWRTETSLLWPCKCSGVNFSKGSSMSSKCSSSRSRWLVGMCEWLWAQCAAAHDYCSDALHFFCSLQESNHWRWRLEIFWRILERRLLEISLNFLIRNYITNILYYFLNCNGHHDGRSNFYDKYATKTLQNSKLLFKSRKPLLKSY